MRQQWYLTILMGPKANLGMPWQEKCNLLTLQGMSLAGADTTYLADQG